MCQKPFLSFQQKKIMFPLFNSQHTMNSVGSAPPLVPPGFGPFPSNMMFDAQNMMRGAVNLFDPLMLRRFGRDEPKPQHSYIGLIAMAILSSEEQKMVLSDIYQWILDHYPYFRWKYNFKYFAFFGFYNTSFSLCTVCWDVSVRIIYIGSGRWAGAWGKLWKFYRNWCIFNFYGGPSKIQP